MCFGYCTRLWFKWRWGVCMGLGRLRVVFHIRVLIASALACKAGFAVHSALFISVLVYWTQCAWLWCAWLWVRGPGKRCLV